MALRSTMSLLGLYNANNHLFDNVVFPEALDRNTIIDNLLAETAELEVLYTDPDFMSLMLETWSKKQITVWNELYATTQYVYNPIWNKDGTRIETRDLHGTDNLDRDYSDNETRNFSGSASSTTTDSVYGFNSTTAADASKSVGSGSTTDTGTGSHVIRDDADRTTSDTGTVTILEQGNIGVTSTQELIERQRAVVQFNVIDYIIADFKKRFCLMVY